MTVAVETPNISKTLSQDLKKGKKKKHHPIHESEGDMAVEACSPEADLKIESGNSVEQQNSSDEFKRKTKKKKRHSSKDCSDKVFTKGAVDSISQLSSSDEFERNERKHKKLKGEDSLAQSDEISSKKKKKKKKHQYEMEGEINSFLSQEQQNTVIPEPNTLSDPKKNEEAGPGPDYFSFSNTFSHKKKKKHKHHIEDPVSSCDDGLLIKRKTLLDKSGEKFSESFVENKPAEKIDENEDHDFVTQSNKMQNSEDFQKNKNHKNKKDERDSAVEFEPTNVSLSQKKVAKKKKVPTATLR